MLQFSSASGLDQLFQFFCGFDLGFGGYVVNVNI